MKITQSRRKPAPNNVFRYEVFALRHASGNTGNGRFRVRQEQKH
jgi:hypothetical protein